MNFPFICNKRNVQKMYIYNNTFYLSYSSPKEERKKMESTNKGENGHALFSNFQSTPNKTETEVHVQLSSPQWSRIHGVAVVAPALEQHRAKVGNVRNKTTKKVTICQVSTEI